MKSDEHLKPCIDEIILSLFIVLNKLAIWRMVWLLNFKKKLSCQSKHQSPWKDNQNQELKWRDLQLWTWTRKQTWRPQCCWRRKSTSTAWIGTVFQYFEQFRSRVLIYKQKIFLSYSNCLHLPSCVYARAMTCKRWGTNQMREIGLKG